MKKVTRRLLTVGAILAIGACGDTVEVVVPPPPPPPPPIIPVPPPPPLPPPNRAPVAVGSIPAIAVDAGATASFDAAGYFSDADGDALTFSAGSSNAAAATVSMAGSSATVTGVADGTAVVTITARDPDGAAAAQNVSVTVGDGVAANRPPTAVNTIPAYSVDVGGAVQVNLAPYFSDADGDALSYAASSSNEDAATVSVEGALATISGVADGMAVVTVTASDPDGASASQTISVTVGDGDSSNTPPVAQGTIPDHSVAAGGTLNVDVTGYFSDADGDELTYMASSSNADVATATIDGATVTISGVGGGRAVITVTASDGEATVAQGFNVTVEAAPENTAPSAVGTIPNHSVGVGGTVTVNASGYFSDADGDELSYTVASSNADVATATADGSTVTISGVAAGSAVITVTASDGEASAVQGFSVAVEAAPSNNAPAAVGTIPNHSVGVGGTVTVNAVGYFNDADGDELSYTVASSNADVATASNEGSTVTISGVAAGSAVITVTASDAEASAVQGFSVAVEAAPTNNAPTAVGTIPAHSINLGGTATVDVAGYFSDADGDELGYSGSSSSPEVATVTMEGSTATITGVAVGGAVVTVTASDGSASASQGFSVSVSDPSGKPATVAIFGLRDVTDRNTAVDPTDVSGDVSVLLDVQPNDETIAGIALTLGEQAIHCRGTSSDQAGFIAAASGQLEVECLFKTADVMGECAGAQLPPLYANGDHTLGARVTTADGESREAIVTQPVTLNNSGFVMVVHGAGSASAVVSGVTYHGGPVAEDDDGNQNAFHACPVSYDGTTVGELALETMLTGPGATELEVGEDETKPPTLAITKQGDAFTWNVDPARNRGVENRRELDEHWVINSGDIKDDGGLLVTSKFRGEEEAMIGPLYFDFKAPTWTHDPDEDEPQEILIPMLASRGPEPVLNEYYNRGALSIRGLTDGGVGDASATFAVGDCSMAANSDSLKSTAFVPAEGLANVSNVSQLPEEDKEKEFADDAGLNCYVGEVTGIADGLGNEATLPGVPIGTRNYFGVDKGRPVVTDVEPAASGTVLKREATLRFEAEDPDLDTGENGSGLWGVNWTVGSSRVSSGASPTAVLRLTSSAFPRDGAYRATADIFDNAYPGNGSRVAWSFTRDTKAPEFTVSKSQPDIGNTQATRVTVSVGGTISDANGIERAELSIRSKAGGSCPTADDDDLNLAATRVSGNKRDLSSNGSTTITFDETFTLNAPGAGVAVPENLCFFLVTADVATDEKGGGSGNTEVYEVGSFSVGWPDPGPTYKIGAVVWNDPGEGASITADAPLQVTEGAAAGAQFVITLDPPPATLVRFSLSAPPTVNIPSSVDVSGDGTNTVSAPVMVTAGHDRNVISDRIEITATAVRGSDANYAGRTVTIAVLAADDDVSMVSDVNTVTEDTPFAGTGAVAKWATITLTAPEGGRAPLAPIDLGGGQGSSVAADYTFTAVTFMGNNANPYDPDAAAITTFTPLSFSDPAKAYVDVWIVANDDTDDEEVETIQIGAEPNSEVERLEPIFISIEDADPDVTLSIDAVEEGADEVTMTVTATSNGAMPGIFEIDADRWALIEKDGGTALADAGYAVVASGTLTIDRNEKEGTVSVTVSVPEGAGDSMFSLNLAGGGANANDVELSDDTDVSLSVSDLEVTVEAADDGNGGG
ncbi:Ig-like domain-containing protein [Candidatus Palauibacter sp.]|uniref:Ig-like domain-containing protein n=1 Tax=Candidatus Palauibacter sp. TaxID=3101350 RepID=UPI003AF30D78